MYNVKKELINHAEHFSEILQNIRTLNFKQKLGCYFKNAQKGINFDFFFTI
jgi:hypothetical protein